MTSVPPVEKLHLGELIEVVVGRRSTGGAHVGDRHAVNEEVVLAGCNTLSTERRLLTGLVTTNVDAIDENAGRLVEDGPRVTGGRDLLELDLADRGALLKLALIEQRGLGGDRDGLLDSGGESQRNAGVAVDADGDAGVLDGAKAFEFSLNGVGARIESQEAELPLCVGDLGSSERRGR